MKITIQDSTIISEIQNSFNGQFPHLKLEFFEFGKGEKRIFSKKNMVGDNNRKVGQLRNMHTKGTISFNGHQKVSTLENNFLQNHGLNVQVFRRVGKNWLETSTSDSLTLSKQNQSGGSAKTIKIEKTAMDFDLYHEQS